MSFPQDAAPGGMHYHVELMDDCTLPERGKMYTASTLDEALDLAGAFIRFYEALFNATRERDEAPIHAEMTVGKDVITPASGEVYFELTLHNPRQKELGRNAVARVTPCKSHLTDRATAIQEVLAKLLGMRPENIHVVDHVVDRDMEPDEFPSPVIRYKGRGEGMSPN
jgi:hypothetical protein